MAESRKSPKKVTEKWKKTEKVPESRKKHLGGNRKMAFSSHGKPEKWELCGKRKDKLDASQQKAKIARKISCIKKSGSFFYCVPIIHFHTCRISCISLRFLVQRFFSAASGSFLLFPNNTFSDPSNLMHFV